MPITITSNRHLFRRCGVAHPKDPTEYPDDRFTDAELKVLKSDPMLTVIVTEAEKEPEKTKAPVPEPDAAPAPETKPRKRTKK